MLLSTYWRHAIHVLKVYFRIHVRNIHETCFNSESEVRKVQSLSVILQSLYQDKFSVQPGETSGSFPTLQKSFLLDQNTSVSSCALVFLSFIPRRTGCGFTLFRTPWRSTWKYLLVKGAGYTYLSHVVPRKILREIWRKQLTVASRISVSSKISA